jgi:hypothetical protein
VTDGFDVAVMVATNQPWDFESETSRLIREAIRAAGVQVRLLVIENGIAGARPGLEVFPGLGEILRLELGNKSAALNAGLELLSRETLIVYFDDDVLIPKGILGAYAASARRLGPDHYFGGPTTARLEAPPGKAVARYLPNSARGLSYGTAPRMGSDFFLGFNWAAFSSDIKAIGGFDTRFGPGSSPGATGNPTRSAGSGRGERAASTSPNAWSPTACPRIAAPSPSFWGAPPRPASSSASRAGDTRSRRPRASP